jgi:hypothetical protein
VLDRFGPAAGGAAPVLTRLRSLLPSVRSTSRGLPPLARTAIPALRSTTSAVRRVTPVFEGLRPYAPDLISSLFSGTNGWAAGYDANGHYLRLQLSEPTLTGILAPLTDLNLPDLLNPRTGLTARCPGGAAEPAPDRSNPWVVDRSVCDPEHDHR